MNWDGTRRLRDYAITDYAIRLDYGDSFKITKITMTVYLTPKPAQISPTPSARLHRG